MSSAIIGLLLVFVVAIAADFRVLNALICLSKSIKHRLQTRITKGKVK